MEELSHQPPTYKAGALPLSQHPLRIWEPNLQSPLYGKNDQYTTLSIEWSPKDDRLYKFTIYDQAGY